MTAKKLLQIISTILVALVVLLAVALVGVRLAGIRTFTVLSGSMEPTYHVGSLIYVKKVDSTTIRPGQVITFMLDENTVATHRVVEVIPDEDDPSTLRFRTKGDANDAEDGSLVHYKNVIGTPGCLPFPSWATQPITSSTPPACTWPSPPGPSCCC